MEQVTIRIEGMSCGHCLNAVNQALAGLAGVSIGTVQIGRATLAYDPAQINPERLVAAIGEAGYQAAVTS